MSITTTHNRVARSLQWPALVVLGLVLAGCGDRLKWTEDVLLPDGRTVTLTRLQEINGPAGEPFGPPTASYRRFDFVNPDNGETVRWENDRDLATVALMISAKEPWLLTTPQFGGSLQRYRCPEPPYVALQYVGGEWREVPLERLPAKVIRANMSGMGVSSDYVRRYIEGHRHHLSAGEVAEHVDDMFLNKVIDLSALEKVIHHTYDCGAPFNYMTRDAGEYQ